MQNLSISKSLYTFWNPKVGEGLIIAITISLGDVWGSGRRIEEERMFYLSLPTFDNSLAGLYEVVRSEWPFCVEDGYMEVALRTVLTMLVRSLAISL